jgi:hypothetical protein
VKLDRPEPRRGGGFDAPDEIEFRPQKTEISGKA